MMQHPAEQSSFRIRNDTQVRVSLPALEACHRTPVSRQLTLTRRPASPSARSPAR